MIVSARGLPNRLAICWNTRWRPGQYCRFLSKSSSKTGLDPPHEPTDDHPFKKFHQTDADTVFTVTSIGKEYQEHVLPHRSLANKIFSLPTHYVHPKEFNYALPVDNVPEFAFVGRSNVGKSSLIAVLLHSKALVKVSKSPGCTNSVNYFAFAKRSKRTIIDSSGADTGAKSGKRETKNQEMTQGTKRPELYLVDLPGYGFAKKGKAEQKRWKAFIHSYLSSRDMSILRRVFLLVDSRHSLKNTDLEMMEELNALHLPYQIVLTKTDSASKLEMYKTLSTCFDAITRQGGKSTCIPYIFATSSKDQNGIVTLKDSIAEVLSHQWAPRQRPSRSKGSGREDKLLGFGPEGNTVNENVASFGEVSPNNSDSNLHYDDNYDDGNTNVDNSLDNTLGRRSSSNVLSAEEFKSVLTASGTSRSEVDRLLKEFEMNLEGK